MIKATVVYFDYQPLSQQVYDDYYLGQLVAAGCRVEYLDLTQLYFPSFYKEVSFEGIKIYYISSFSELERVIAGFSKDTLFVSRLTFTDIVVRLFRLFKKYNCQLVALTRGAFPSMPVTDKMIDKLRQPSQYFSYLKKVGTILLKKVGYIQKYKYVFNCGTSLGNIGLGWKYDVVQAKIISVNTCDFERIRDTKEVPLAYKYIVFLDEYFPFHPDFKMFGKCFVDEKIYYGHLNALFKKIEAAYQLPVVIAAHPKAELYKTHNYYEGREVLFGKTAELVKNSLCVLAHYSTSIGYAIATEKPLVFLNALLYKQNIHRIYQFINFLGQYLNTKVLTFDDAEVSFSIPIVDKGRYERYKYSFLTNKETEELNSGDIFVKEIINGRNTPFI
ncbi:hypothetical protein [Capnocytophaga leadbetteri]|jgi:hypothetical protein|uniref:hypothetical protein n=1 Tax=Capnocytophaga leadbetteri TaxID=327575 RepID=UPI0028D019AE|nr:hypothetical protein [Capnocytophaga leadbetteri]